MSRKIKIIVWGIWFLMLGCKDVNTSVEETAMTETATTTLSEEQLYRPNFHFTPKAN